MLSAGQRHQSMEGTIALCRKHFHRKTIYKDVAEYVKNCPCCQVAKGHYMGPKTKSGSIIANRPLNLLYVDFTKMYLSRDGKEDVLVLTDVFSKFSKTFVSANQEALTMAEIIVEIWLYIYGLPSCIHSDKADHLKMRYWNIYIPCMGLKHSQPCPTTHMEIPPVRGFMVCSLIY